MKTIEINLYKFSELSEEAKQKAIEKLWSISVDHDWWEYIYEDAEQVGLKITGFDIDRGNCCEGDFINSATEVAQDVLNNHGENCETYETAQNFLNEHNPLFAQYMNESSIHYESAEIEDRLMDIENEFEQSLLEDYKIMLSKEYEFLTEEKQVIEIIEANDYDFTEDGEIY